jgi:hypothetical protein
LKTIKAWKKNYEIIKFTGKVSIWGRNPYHGTQVENSAHGSRV